MRTINEKQIKNKLKTLNSHWITNHIDSEIEKKRKRRYFDLFFPLVSQFDVQRAILLMGTRRVGKTVMLKQTIQQFIDNGKKAKELIYIPLDEPLFYNTSLEELVLLAKKTVNINSLAKTIIIFDEVQYTKDWNIHLKVLVDNYPHTKFVASGSAAGAIKKQGSESGAGRFTDFILPALTFYEYLDMLELTGNYIIFNKNDNKAIGIKHIDQLNDEFINYLNYGGFPEAIFNKNIRNDFERYIRHDIVDKVLLRDLPSLYGITDIQELNRLFSYLCYQTGNEINYDSLSKSSGIAKNTIKKYIQYLETAFLIRTVRRVDETGKTFKRNNYFKIYLTNPSMYSALYGIVDDLETQGQLVETALFSQWAHDASWLDRIYYARFKKGKSEREKTNEVDMVYIDQKFTIPWCLEVKWSDRYPKHPEELKGLIKFCKINRPNSITVSTKSIRKDIKKDNLNMIFKEAALICFNIGYTSIHKTKKE